MSNVPPIPIPTTDPRSVIVSIVAIKQALEALASQTAAASFRGLDYVGSSILVIDGGTF